jgi:hypothetical protein
MCAREQYRDVLGESVGRNKVHVAREGRIGELRNETFRILYFYSDSLAK